MINRLSFRTIAVLLALTLAVLPGLSLAGTADRDCALGTWWINHSEVGYGLPLPEFGFETCDGGERSISDYTGKPVLVNFWATWCPPCVEELPNLSKFAEDAGGEVEVLGISLDLEPAEVRRFLEQHDPGYTVTWDGGGIARDLGISSIPLTIALNAEGELVGLHKGFASVEDLKALAERAK